MNKMLLPIVAAALAVGLATAAPASATEQSYLADLKSNGYDGGTPAEALTLGYKICVDYDNGEDEDTIVEAIYKITDDTIEYKDAVFLYEAAVIHLC